MDIWKSRDGKSQGRKRVRRKKMQVREKVDKSRNTVVLQCFVAPDSGGSEGRLSARFCGVTHILKSKQ